MAARSDDEERALKTGPQTSRSRATWGRALLLPLLVMLFFLLARWLDLGVGLGETKGWIESHGILGAGVFMLLFALVGVSALPGLPFTIAAGALFGTWKGLLIASGGTMLGATLAFVMARSLAREFVRRRLEHRKVFALVETWSAERGAVTVALTRLFPIFPYSLLNFALGLTALRFRTYFFWSWLCMLPGHLFYVSGADALLKGIETGEVPWKLVLLAAGVLVLLASLLPWARRSLKEGPGRGVSDIEGGND